MYDEKKISNLIEDLKAMKVGAVSVDYVVSELEACRIEESAKAAEFDFDKLWKAYPYKIGKAAVTMKAKKELSRQGVEKILRCIDNYKKSKPEWQNWMNGSTFFNGRWKDFEKLPEAPAKTSKSPYQERTYDENFLNDILGYN